MSGSSPPYARTYLNLEIPAVFLVAAFKKDMTSS